MTEDARSAARDGSRLPRTPPVSGAGEFDLIARIRARAARSGERDDVILGIGDDAALLRVPAGRLLVVATDTLNDGVHFPAETLPFDVGWKALAVNLSDLAAMGAEPAWASLSLSMRDADAAWLDGFLDGFFALADQFGIALVGGDTTRGHLSIGVTVYGFLVEGHGMRRGGAQVDDDVWVTGTLGDAAAALSQWRAGGAADPALRTRMDRPEPRVEAGRKLSALAHACIDVSDGLLADLGHICAASRVGARVDVDGLPASDALRALLTEESRRLLQATGGDDYELCFTAAPAERATVAAVAEKTGVAMTRIGKIITGSGVSAFDAQGGEWQAPRAGFDHFGG
jgi:thiamine-monophosphate kinase